MKSFEIGRKSGTGGIFGVYEGRDEDDALDAMAQDMGYSDFRDLCLVNEVHMLSKYRFSDMPKQEAEDDYVASRRADYVVTRAG